jgi:hypothetical protein
MSFVGICRMGITRPSQEAWGTLNDAWLLALLTALKNWDMWKVTVSFNWDGCLYLVQKMILKCCLHHQPALTQLLCDLASLPLQLFVTLTRSYGAT